MIYTLQRHANDCIGLSGQVRELLPWSSSERSEATVSKVAPRYVLRTKRANQAQ